MSLYGEMGPGGWSLQDCGMRPHLPSCLSIINSRPGLLSLRTPAAGKYTTCHSLDPGYTTGFYSLNKINTFIHRLPTPTLVPWVFQLGLTASVQQSADRHTVMLHDMLLTCHMRQHYNWPTCMLTCQHSNKPTCQQHVSMPKGPDCNCKNVLETHPLVVYKKIMTLV